MTRSASFLLLLLALPSAAAVAEEEAPLPKGVLARMGKSGSSARDEVRSVAFSPDGKILASGGGDKVVHLWDPATGRELKTLEGHARRVNAVAFSPDGKMLASASDDSTLRLWDVLSGQEVGKLEGHEYAVQALAFSPDGRLLASGGDDGTLRLWEASSRTERFKLRAHTGRVASVAFSPDGSAVLSAGIDNRVRSWRTGTGQEVLCLKGLSAYVRVSGDGGRMAVSGNPVRICEASTGREILTLEAQKDSSFVLAFSPDGTLLAMGSSGNHRELDHAIRIWETVSGKEVLALKGHVARVNALAFSPDGRTLASGSEDRSVLVWGLPTPAEGSSPEALWEALAGPDVLTCVRARLALAASPATALPLLEDRFRIPDADRIARLIHDLDDDRYETRLLAFNSLRDVGEAAEPALRKTLAADPSPEVRDRIGALLEALATAAAVPTPEVLRSLRAVQALGGMGTPEARDLLSKLAEGAPGSRIVREARAALDSLGR